MDEGKKKTISGKFELTFDWALLKKLPDNKLDNLRNKIENFSTQKDYDFSNLFERSAGVKEIKMKSKAGDTAVIWSRKSCGLLKVSDTIHPFSSRISLSLSLSCEMELICLNDNQTVASCKGTHCLSPLIYITQRLFFFFFFSRHLICIKILIENSPSLSGSGVLWGVWTNYTEIVGNVNMSLKLWPHLLHACFTLYLDFVMKQCENQKFKWIYHVREKLQWNFSGFVIKKMNLKTEVTGIFGQSK